MGRVEEFWIQEGRRAVSSRKAQAARAVQLYWDAISRQMSWGAQCEVEWPLSGNGHVRGGVASGRRGNNSTGTCSEEVDY
jgi:hypothetical protein